MVYLVGAGPGDPGLITVKALDLLRRADVVLYDRLIDASFISETKPSCILIDVGKTTGKHTKVQTEITDLLVEYGKKNLVVVRLKGGDPFLFGRGGEEAERLAEEGISYAVVPGVSALTAVAAYAGIPLTHRDVSSSVGVVTGHGAHEKNHDPVRWRELARAVDTIVVFMGVETVKTITDEIMRGGCSPDTPSAVIEQGTTPSQRIILGTLSTIAEKSYQEHITSPALLIVGKTAAFADKLRWFTPGPLAGIRIGITRPREQSQSFADKLRTLGASPVFMPTIEPSDAIDSHEVIHTLSCISHYQYIVFTSANGVNSFFRALNKCGKDARVLAAITIASIGPATSDALNSHGITADVTAERYIAEGLLDVLRTKESLQEVNILLVRSDMGRDTLLQGLRDAGAHVDQIPFYTLNYIGLSPQVSDMVKSGEIDMVTFTSSSTVESFFHSVPVASFPETVQLASIGPQTSATLRGYNKPPDIEASEYTTDGLIKAILDYYMR